MTELTCSSCDTSFSRRKAQVLYSKRTTPNAKIFCSKQCQNLGAVTSSLYFCANCKKEFKRVPSSLTKVINVFCSQSCAATFNNTRYPKRLPEGVCYICNTSISKQKRVCKGCTLDINQATLKDLLRVGTYKYDRIHSRASYIRKERPKLCERCGYTRHVEVCHIRPVSSFGMNDKLSEINSRDNLLLLCPNCHWELDHPEVSL